MVDVCAVDGVQVVIAKSGRFVHVDELPRGTEDHDIRVITRESFGESLDRRSDLRKSVEDMLLHHDSIHPSSDCAFSENLHRALRASAV